MKNQKIIGITLILGGVFFILNSLSGITGFIIIESIGKKRYSIFGLIFIIGGVFLLFQGSFGQKLYHGTCKAFVDYAQERGGLFGSEGEELFFTPDLDHAKMIAKGWKEKRGREKLNQYFSGLPEQYLEPVVLEFNPRELRKLKKRLDTSDVIQFSRKGPVKLGKKIDF